MNRLQSHIFLSIILLFSFCSIGQELLIPSAGNVKDEVLFSKDSVNVVGNGFFPISYSSANYTFPNKDTNRGWAYRKVFKEHFIQQQGENFILAVDPLFNMSLGKEQLQQTYSYLFQNTRGVQAFAQLKDKLAIYTSFYENQARFVDYQQEYFADRGEQYFNSGVYNVQNAVIPNGGRSKPFKMGGLDYLSSMSYVRLTPIKSLAIQFGNQPRFFGWGHRSLLLSDNSFNYTHLSIDWEIIPGLSYTFIRGKQLNLFRKMHTTLVEAPYERKGIGVHYLNYRISPSLVVGLFESTVYLRDEGDVSNRVSPYFYQPIIGVNTAFNGGESALLKNVLGLNLAWKFHAQHMVYGQAVVDDFSHLEYGFQLGYRTGNTFNIKDLRFQLEYNQASSSLYAAENHRMAYTHFNLPLAHTLGNGFKELLVRASYKWKGVFIEGSAVYYHANQKMDNKTRLFQSKQVAFGDNQTTVLNGNLELGYEFNSATRLRVFVSGNYRMSDSNYGGKINYGMITFGLKSALINQYFDF